MMSSSGAVPAALTAARARLADANMFMRYDYAWKETEFGRAETRMAGVACRVLYLHAVWRALADSKAKAEATPNEADGDAPRTRAKVLVDANGYAPFHDEVARACALMDCDVIDAAAQPDGQLRAQAQLAFVYVSPHGEERVKDQYATFKAVTAYHSEHQTPADARPLFCFLLGEAAFLDPPANDEVERLRGLSGFAISQRFSPLLDDAAYTSVAHFAVEYTPEVGSTRPDSMSDLMNRFGCMDYNVMEHVEKWEMYAFQESVFHQNAELTAASDDEVRYWLEHTHGKACDACHAWREKLLRCSRCGSACYCSRECQKSAWKLHKQLCGKTAAEISAAQDADVSATPGSK